MREVSCRVVSVWEHAALTQRIRFEDLVEGLPVTLAFLRNRHEWIDWDVLAEIADRFERMTTPAASIQAGWDAIDLEVVGPLRRVVGLTMGVELLYRTSVQWQLPLLYRNVHATWRHVGPREVQVEFSIPSHFRGSEAWFRTSIGGFENLSKICGLPPATVIGEISSHRATYRITLPAQRRGLLTVMRALFRDAALEELARQIAEIRQIERERLLVDAALRERERMLTNLIANLSGMVYRCRSDDWTFTFATDRAFELTGHSSEELVEQQMSIYALAHPEDVETLRASRDANLAARKPASNEYRLRTRTGELRRVLDVARGVYGTDGQLLAIEGFITDITASRRLEEELTHAMRVEGIGRLAGGIAHDFNNLLAVIFGAAELARLTLPPRSPAREYTDQICVAAERAADLTKQLLAFARKQAFAPRVVSLNDLVINVDRMLRRTLLENIELVSVLAAELWPVEIDVGQFEQVIVNLAINARDAMPHGGTLTIETANLVLEEDAPLLPGLTPGLYVMLSVTDTGRGMSEEVQARAFEPFFTTKEVGKGTGLGLASAYGIVHQARGQIYLCSEIGHGTTLHIYLPRSSGEAGRLTSEPPATLPPAAAREAILVVEDHELLRALVVRALVAQGYRVRAAANGIEALELARRDDYAYDLLLTDVVMPKMSGRELAERMLAERPNLPVLFVSGFSDQGSLRDQRSRTSTSFLAKPFTPAALVEKVREVLDRGRKAKDAQPTLFLVR